VAKKIGSHKGYVSGIENDKVNPPSVKIIKKFAKLFNQDERTLVRIAWATRRPRSSARMRSASWRSPTPRARPRSISPASRCSTPSRRATPRTSPRTAGEARRRRDLALPKTRTPLEFAATVCDDSMEQQGGSGFSRGDVVLLTKEDKIRNGSMVYIVFSLRQKRQALVRQVMLEQGDHIVLQP